ncbi:MAG: DNA starvation/stationary phase protection protein [Streptosporangiales bacterium]|nr:DNA starvation/stationary phase protection protein [Streptosporangiales bacterium]
MTTINGPLEEKATAVTGDALQDTLVDLIDLSLTAKQAHWNLVGKRFRSIHLQLDELVSAARGYTDQVAERAAALGVNPDGTAGTVAANSQVPQFDAGWLSDDGVVAHLVAVYQGVIARMRERIATTGDTDVVTQDLFISLTAELEKECWMLQAER